MTAPRRVTPFVTAALFLGMVLATGGTSASAQMPAAPASPSSAHLSLLPAGRCTPTPPDSLGPFYKPHAPLRNRVGRGYVLSGTVRSAMRCTPIRNARLEMWLANPQGVYDDAHRATLRVNARGVYRFESNVPVAYSGRPPHIHIRVTAPGFRTLVTQHYPRPGQRRAVFDLVLVPAG